MILRTRPSYCGFYEKEGRSLVGVSQKLKKLQGKPWFRAAQGSCKTEEEGV